MAISDRITSIEEHIKESYQELEGIGIDTTGVNNNLENIPKLIDGYWETLPKVTGEGTSITLDNTKEGKMKINLKGNTSQATTTQSKNLMPNEAESQTINGLTITKGTDGSLLINGTSTATTKIELGTTNLASGTYTLSTHKEGTVDNSCYLRTIDTTTESEISGTSFNIYNSNSKTYTLSENKKVKFDFYTGGSRTFTNFKIYPMAESGSTATDYVKFVPNSPSPDYPQDIHVVSGDNTIKVEGKNLFKLDFTTEQTDVAGLDFAYTNSSFTLKGTTRGTYKIARLAYVPSIKKGETYIFSRNVTGISPRMQITLNFYDSNNTNLGNTKITPSNNEVTFTPNFSIEEVDHVNFVIEALNNNTAYDCYVELQIEKGTEKTSFEEYKGASYPISLGDIELCEIGTYQDNIKKSTGKNLFNDTFELGGITLETGQNTPSSNRVRTKEYTSVLPSTQYTISGVSGSRYVFYYNSNKDYLSYELIDSQTTSGTFTTPNNTAYIRWYVIQTNTNINEMLNEGTTALPYEPYGKVWYLNKQIGKVVLNGSENWLVQGSNANYYEYRLNNGVENSGTNIQNEVKTNYFNQTTNSRVMINNAKTIYLRFPTSSGIDISTLELFKTWLSTHNTIVYYALATPTYTEITDSTLISQLNALAKSYASQTNISQESNDLASLLNATALEEM